MQTTDSSIIENLQRPRRNRSSEAIRNLVKETRLTPNDFVQPLFVKEGSGENEPINGLPGIERLTLDSLLKEAEEILKLGIPAIALFPVISPDKKDRTGTEALNPNQLTCRALKLLKKEFPELCLIADVALDPFTDHGHDGIVNNRGEILNDETVNILSQMACVLASAGADIVAPSDMMDGRIESIRRKLDQDDLKHTSILSYAAKYASSLYGPFREAVGSGLSFGNKKTYQMDPANIREALRECDLDECEGADILMIKPASLYLDVIAKVKEQTNLPVAAYHVSGEYAMALAAGEKGWLDGESILKESLLSIKRAGADIIFTYAAKQLIFSGL